MTAIDPMWIPHFTGDLGALEKDITGLGKDASDIRSTGADTHSTFQGLSPVFDTPERDQLLAATLPVRQRGDHFAGQLGTAKSALAEYAAEVRPIIQELDRLREQAAQFRDSIRDDEHWQRDQKKIDRNTELIQAVAVAQARFMAAEVTAANKITALFDGPRFRADDGTHQKGMYGYKPSDVAKAEKTPWGEVEDRELTGWDKAWHGITHNPLTDFATGFVVDGTWGTVRGLATLFGWDGGDKAGDAWGKLNDTVTGIGLYSVRPVELLLHAAGLPDKPDADETRARKAARDFGKSLVAWDEWDKNPSRAAGTVAFNVLTLGSSALMKAGKAGEAGQAGKIGLAELAGAAGKLGQVVDPMTYVGGGARAGLTAVKVVGPKVGDLMSELKQNLGRMPDHTPRSAETSVRLPTWTGEARYLDPDGTLRNADHGVRQPGVAALKEPGGTELTARQEHRAMAHAGGHGSAHPGDNAPHAAHSPASGSDNGHSSAPGGTHHGSAGHQSHPDGSHGHSASGGTSHTGDGLDGHTPSPHHAGHGTGGEAAGHKLSGHITDEAFHHVLSGEIKYGRDGRPRVAGYHFRPGGRDPWGIKVPKILKLDHRTGITQGNVWMRDPRSGEWVMKRNKSTFFPLRWSEKEVRRAMTKAFENGKIVDADSCKWRGEYKGVVFEGYYDAVTGDAVTIYPLLP
ncbi:EndoU domain-containing protein [Streptomyces sp. NPDC049577]|uniref:EndoU domain-containing protein n=1 Tax=Streptomyces sp. NPDC049577 TaxID=3155153 RepID=UPI00342F1A8B